MEKLSGEVTRLLAGVREGAPESKSRLIELLQNELKSLARKYMRGERKNHTLQTTALINEAYIRLLGTENPAWQNRLHFLAHAARAMRQILVDHARQQRSAKRGGKEVRISLDHAIGSSDSPLVDTIPAPTRNAQLLALDEALNELAQLDSRQAEIVELRYFGGLSEKEIGASLHISDRTVRRDLQTANLWLKHRLAPSSRQ
jgi:RNA polymerase sigma-70 factor, ECF subfamily